MAFGVAIAGFLVFRNSSDDQRPLEGSLIVNVNTATREELQSVPDVGPILAMQIISNRPYATVDHLARVYAIVPEQVDEMRPYIKAEGDTEKRY